MLDFMMKIDYNRSGWERCLCDLANGLKNAD